jgi:hypothetical protein
MEPTSADALDLHTSSIMSRRAYTMGGQDGAERGACADATQQHPVRIVPPRLFHAGRRDRPNGQRVLPAGEVVREADLRVAAQSMPVASGASLGVADAACRRRRAARRTTGALPVRGARRSCGCQEQCVRPVGPDDLDGLRGPMLHSGSSTQAVRVPTQVRPPGRAASAVVIPDRAARRV